MLNNLVDGIDSFFMWLNSVLKQNLSDYCDLETAQDKYSLVAKDGSLLTVVKISGYRSLINVASFYENISDPLNSGLDTFFDKSGHMMQVWFSVDPTKSEQAVRNALTPSYETMKRLGMDATEILDEQVKIVSERANYEECYMVLWTRPSSIVKGEMKEENDRKKKIRQQQVSSIKYSQDPLAGNSLLQNKHTTFVDNVLDLFLTVGVAAEKLDVYESLRAVRKSIDDQHVSENWEALLPGDPIYPNIRHDKAKGEEWDIIWPKLSWQVCQQDAEIIGKKLVKIGNKVYSPGYIDLLAKETTSFDDLFSRIGSNYPWRISFTIESNGLSAVTTRALFASILGFTSGDNKLLNNSVKNLRNLRDSYNQSIVKTRISFCTWGDKNKIPQIENQFANLAQTIETWGNCAVSTITGDPLGGVMSSSLGATYNSVATYSAVPLAAMTFIMPFSRPTSGWSKGSVLFLSPDKKLIPYQPGSSEQTTWIHLFFSKPGSGKSVLMNITNYALCIAPGIQRLPRIGIVDIGPSSSGLISLIAESLPQEQRHLAQYHRILMTDDYCINVFDTQLGCRYPTSAERSFLINFITQLVTDANSEKPESAISNLINAVIEHVYEYYSDKIKPKLYSTGVSYLIDDTIKELGIELDNKTSWWEIVDKLFENDKIKEASMAQRYAVPLLSDLTSSAQDERIRQIYSNVKVSTGEDLTDYFNRTITETLMQYRILSRPTIFDLEGARIVSLDLDEVAKPGGVQANKQTGIMYMLARYVLGKDFKLIPESVNEMPYPGNIKVPPEIPATKYKSYHTKRIEDSKEDYKRLCFDEFHRTSNSPMVREQVLLDMREGRKWNLDVSLSSQTINDFDETMKSFATGIFIMDSGTESDIQDLVKTFGIEDEAEIHALRKGRVHGPRNGKPGVFMAKFITNTGNYTQLLSAHVGPIEMWALSTTAEDATLRSRMYKILGPSKARTVLAKYYPKGIKKVVELRKETMRATGAYTDDDSNIYIQLIEEMLQSEQKNR